MSEMTHCYSAVVSLNVLTRIQIHTKKLSSGSAACCGVILGLQGLEEADWATDHKRVSPCEIPPSVGDFSRPGAPQPTRDTVVTG